jgi:16S rRNA (cytidine1402-2'-O)-methyltransferase
MPKAVIAIGSNLGDSRAIVSQVIEKTGQLPGITLLRQSKLITSQPAYQIEQPDFTNAVIFVDLEPDVSPLELLRNLHKIEEDFGRSRDRQTLVNGPRTLDLDIIDVEGVVSDDPELMLPHPLALERDFVVNPLLEICPEYQLADGSPVRLEEPAGNVLGSALGNALDSKDSAQAAAARSDINSALGTVVANKAGRTLGKLQVCSVPIGNLQDITLRAIKALSAADMVLAEDTRVARRLLSHLNLRPPIKRCDENVIRQRTPEIIDRLREGQSLVFIPDAGTPGVSDPGMFLVAAARSAGAQIEVLPGASALLAALVAAGFAAEGFYFGGFLPRKPQQRQKVLEQMAETFDKLDAALIFYESPHRCAASLEQIAKQFPKREVTFCRELTKLHEEVIRGSAVEIAAKISARLEVKGEVVIVIGPPPPIKKAPHKDKYSELNKSGRGEKKARA